MEKISIDKLHNIIFNPIIEQLLRSTVKTITDITEADTGLLFLYNSQKDTFDLLFTIDKKGTYNYYNSQFDDDYLKNILHSKSSKKTAAVSSNKKHFSKISSLLDYQFSCSLVSEIKCDNYTFGIIEILRTDASYPFSETDNQTVKKLISLAESTLKGNITRDTEGLSKTDKSGETLDQTDFVIGKSTAIKEILNNISKFAKTNATVLIMGESGTGKEVIAKIIHQNSNRDDKPLYRINCAAIPENLLESELFGHEKGSFTGAEAKKIGKFELADKGTVFLDEIAELPLKLQAKLLIFLQEREIERVGGTNTISVDVRIIAATNKILEKLIEENLFREDLYYRLNVFPLYLPPLRERIEDIPVFVDYFIINCNKEMGKNIKGLTEETLVLLKHYSWPGNIRELGNIIERAIVLAKDNIITPRELPQEIFGIFGKIRQQKEDFKFREGDLTLWKVEKNIIERALRESNFNQSLAAKKLGISRNHLRYRIKKWNIPINK